MLNKNIFIVVIFLQIFGTQNVKGWGSTFFGETHPNSLVLYDEQFKLPGVDGEVLRVDRNISFDLPIQAMGYSWNYGKVDIQEGGMYKNFIIFNTQSVRAGEAIDTRVTLFYNSAIQTSMSIFLIAVSVLVSLYYQS
ncbi:hypothetical protein ACKWTF_000145 [Chironomus riparius]